MQVNHVMSECSQSDKHVFIETHDRFSVWCIRRQFIHPDTGRAISAADNCQRSTLYDAFTGTNLTKLVGDIQLPGSCHVKEMQRVNDYSLAALQLTKCLLFVSSNWRRIHQQQQQQQQRQWQPYRWCFEFCVNFLFSIVCGVPVLFIQ